MNFLISGRTRNDIFNIGELNNLNYNWRRIFPTDLVSFSKDYIKISLYHNQQDFIEFKMTDIHDFTNKYTEFYLGILNQNTSISSINELRKMQLYYTENNNLYDFNNKICSGSFTPYLKFSKISNYLFMITSDDKILSLLDNTNPSIDLLKTDKIKSLEDILYLACETNCKKISNNIYSSREFKISFNNKFGEYLKKYFNFKNMEIISNFKVFFENDEILIINRSGNGFIEIKIDNIQIDFSIIGI